MKQIEQNSENLMKIGWKIRNLWHFEISQIFKKRFVTSQYEYANEWADDVITSHFSIDFVHRNEKKKRKKRRKKKKKKTTTTYFNYENVRLTLITLWIDAE